MAVKKIGISLDSEVGEPDEEAMAQARADLEAIGFWKPETVHEREARLAALARLRGEVADQTHQRAG